MPRAVPIVERPEWPKVLEGAEELAKARASRSEAGRSLGRKYGFSASSFHNACLRGDVPAYPPKDKARATARAEGRSTFNGQKCEICGTLERWVCDNACVKCRLEKYQESEAAIGRVEIPKELKYVPLARRSYWKALLDRSQELAADGKTITGAGRILTTEFPISEAAFVHACNRGDVPAYPSDQLARSSERAEGQTQYVGKACETCGSKIRYTSTDTCVQCDVEYMRQWSRSKLSDV